MKLLTLLFIAFGYSMTAIAQPLYNRGCTAEMTLADKNTQMTLYSHRAVMTYNTNTGILNIRLNLATLTESGVGIQQFSEEILFPNDSTLLEIQVIISQDELTKKNDAYDNARKSIPATIVYKNLNHTVMAEYQFGASMLDPSAPLFLNWDLRYDAMPGEEVYIPGYGFRANSMKLVILDGRVNWVSN